jgi:hypothetical protein
MRFIVRIEASVEWEGETGKGGISTILGGGVFIFVTNWD